MRWLWGYVWGWGACGIGWLGWGCANGCGIQWDSEVGAGVVAEGMLWERCCGGGLVRWGGPQQLWRMKCSRGGGMKWEGGIVGTDVS